MMMISRKARRFHGFLSAAVVRRFVDVAECSGSAACNCG